MNLSRGSGLPDPAINETRSTKLDMNAPLVESAVDMVATNLCARARGAGSAYVIAI